MHNHARPGFEPCTSRLQAPVDTNELLGPVGLLSSRCHMLNTQYLI